VTSQHRQQKTGFAAPLFGEKVVTGKIKEKRDPAIRQGNVTTLVVE